MRLILNDELKIVAKDILLYIDSLCRKNNIRYYIMFGTLIGAIRHKGFIPWDDDIDICLFRADYEKLMSLVEAEGKYRSIHMGNDPNYYFTYGRITDKRTILKKRPKRKIKGFGVFVDVFPIDNAPAKRDALAWRNKFIDIRVKVWATIPTRYDDFYIGNILRYVLRYIREFKTRTSLGVKNFRKYRQLLIECTTQYNEADTNEVMIAETNSFYSFPREIFDDIINVEFEGLSVMAPAQYDVILSSIYGDYMTLPPVAQQVSGHEFKAYWLR